MILSLLLVACSRASDPPICNYDPDRDNFPGGHFPDDFRWSLATASYQIEGAWEEDVKGLGIWDVFSHEKPCKVKNCMNGNIACDSYNQEPRDIENILLLGIKVITNNEYVIKFSDIAQKCSPIKFSCNERCPGQYVSTCTKNKHKVYKYLIKYLNLNFWIIQGDFRKSLGPEQTRTP